MDSIEIPKLYKGLCAQKQNGILSFETEIHDWYTKDQEGNYKGHDTNLLQYLHIPRSPSNVEFNLKSTIQDDDYKFPMAISGNINSFLQWITSNTNKSRKLLEESHFVCGRSVLPKILALSFRAPSNTQQASASPEVFRAIKINGIIFMTRVETDESMKLEYERLDDPGMLESAQQGLKFHQFLCSDSPTSLPNGHTDRFVNNKAGFRIVMTASFASYRLFYPGSTAGILANECIDDFPNITKYRMHTKHFKLNWKNYCDWWIQAKVFELDNMLIGMRENDGFVRQLHIFPASQLTSLAAENLNSVPPRHRTRNRGLNQRNWRDGAPVNKEKQQVNHVKSQDIENILFSCLEKFLDFVHEKCIPGKVVDFTWASQNENLITCSYKEDIESFIPDFFMQWMKDNL